MAGTSAHIIVVAHDSMKPRLVAFLREKEAWLWGRKLIGTDQTAEFIESDGFSVPVDHVSKGREGGYRQLTDRLNRGEIQLVIFFRDAEIVQDYAEDVTEFVKTCIRKNIPLATNPASAELLILGLIKAESAEALKARTQS